MKDENIFNLQRAIIKSNPGNKKFQILSYWDQIEEVMAAGYSLADIHRVMVEDNVVDCKYRYFASIVKRIQSGDIPYSKMMSAKNDE